MQATVKAYMYFISKAYTKDKECISQFVSRPAMLQLLTDGEYRVVLSWTLMIRFLRCPRFDATKDQLSAAKD